MSRKSRQASSPERSDRTAAAGRAEGGSAQERRRRAGRRLVYLAPAILFSFSISENAVAANSTCPPVTGLPPCLPRP